MENVKTQTPTMLHYTALALSVLLACFALFYIDEDTHALTDVFAPGNLLALIIYFTPACALCFVLFKFISKEFKTLESIFLSLVIGIPLGFTMVLFLLFALR
tara:strand:- start:78149 stop:78454 length:306 start_codon:yes stop_codon:yes gene_type:complete